MKGRRILYSADELAWLEANHALPIGDYHRTFQQEFGRADVSAGNINSLRKRRGWKTGRSGRFEKGQVSWNKGKPHPARGRSASTQFKTGVRHGRAAEVYKPIGSERISKDGYLVRKVNDGLPMQSRWRAVHLIRWEAIHGPLPKGMCLKSLDGDKANTDPSNWTLLPRAILPRLNGRFGRKYDGAPAELKPVIMAIAKLAHGAREVRKRRTGGIL